MKPLKSLKSLAVLASFVLLALCLAPPSAQAGGVFVRGGVFGPRVVVNGGGFHNNGFRNNAVVVNRGVGVFGPRVVVNGGFNHGFNNQAVFLNNGFGGHGFAVGQSVFAPRAVVVSPFGGSCINGSCGGGASGLFIH